MKPLPTKEHNYLKKAFELTKDSTLKGGDVDVKHDGWCDYFNGKFCNCNPVVKLRKYTN